MGLTQTVAPASEPVTLAEVQAQIRNWNPDEEDTITALITAARQVIETETHRDFITATYCYTLQGFPNEAKILLPRSPVGTIAADGIKYYDTENVQQTLSSTLYTTYTDEPRGYVWLNYEGTWPSVYTRPDAVQITFTAGYGTSASSTPLCVRQAILLLVSHWWKNRDIVAAGAEKTKIPMTIDALLGPVRIIEAR